MDVSRWIDFNDEHHRKYFKYSNTFFSESNKKLWGKKILYYVECPTDLTAN